MDALTALKTSISESQKYELLNENKEAVEELNQATYINFPALSQEFSLSTTTAFESPASSPPQQLLSTIVNCWQCKDLSVAEYVSKSDEIGIPTLKFLERTDLIEWLQNNISHSEYIKSGDAAQASIPLDTPDASLVISEHEKPLTDHNSVLRGNKPIDFGPLVPSMHKAIVNAIKSQQSGTAGTKQSASSHSSKVNDLMPPLKPAKGKDPIILLSPSPSSLLNLSNVQDFLEKSHFNPTLKSSTSPNLLRISRQSKVIGNKTRFVVVDNVDNFKPEYWDRVVAIFVTGQPWQLRQYKWREPYEIFQRVLGFGLKYKNDPLPEAVKQWNVKVEELERTARFRDKEVVERIWERIEAYMVSRGWPVTSV